MMQKRCCGYIIITEKWLKKAAGRFQSNIELKKDTAALWKIVPANFR